MYGGRRKEGRLRLVKRTLRGIYAGRVAVSNIALCFDYGFSSFKPLHIVGGHFAVYKEGGLRLVMRETPHFAPCFWCFERINSICFSSLDSVKPLTEKTVSGYFYAQHRKGAVSFASRTTSTTESGVINYIKSIF